MANKNSEEQRLRQQRATEFRQARQWLHSLTSARAREFEQAKRSMNRETRAKERAHNQLMRNTRRQVRQSIQLQTRQFRAAARQQRHITRMTEQATRAFNAHFNQVSREADQIAPRMSRVARDNNSVSPSRTQATNMLNSRVLQRDNGQNVSATRNQGNRMREAMHANGLTTNMVAELGASAYQHHFNHPTGTTAQAIQYGRHYINSGHNLLRDANASDTQTKRFDSAINRVKGASVSYRQLRRYGIRHQNLVDKYKGMLSRGNTIASRYRRDYNSEIGKRSILANALKLRGIATSTDDDGHAFVTGNANDSTTGLGQVNQMAKNGNQTAMSYMESNRAIDTYVDDFGTNLRNVNNALTTLKNNLNDLTSSNSNYGSFINNTTANEAQARFNPNATYVHYPVATPTGMLQNMGGTIGLATTGLFTSGSAIRNVNEQGNAVRQQMEPGVNSLTLGRAINGATNIGHIDNHVADQLMREGRWNGQTSAQMSQYLGSLAGTRNTNASNQAQTAGDVARFSRNNNVNPTDTSQLFSTLANAGGLGNQNDRGNVVDFTRQFAGMLHNDHLGAVSGQQAQGLNSIFGNMIGSGQTLTPGVVRNVTAMQGILSSGPGGRGFQGQAGAQQISNLAQGVGSQFSNMMVRNAFANTNPRYGGQQGLYRLQMDMQQPLKHPQQLAGMVQNLSSEGLGASGTEDELTQMGLSPDNARQFYRQAMNGRLNLSSLKRAANRDERQGGSTERHTNRQYRIQGNSTLDIKVAMNQQGQLHTSESLDAARRLGNRFNSLGTGHGLSNNIWTVGRALGGSVSTAANFATLIGMLSGRNGNISSRGLFNLGKHGGISGRLQRSKHPWIRKLGNLTSSTGIGAGGAINAQNNRFNNNYFYNNHFMSGNGTSNNLSSNGNSNNGYSNNSVSNSNEGSSGNSTRDTDDDSYHDKRDSLVQESEEAKRTGNIGRQRQIDQEIADLRRDHLNGGGLGDRFANWMSHGRTSRIPVSNRLVRGLNWLGHGSTGNALRNIRNHMGMSYANTSGYRATEAPYVNRAVDSNLARRVNNISTGIPHTMDLQTFADRSTALRTPSVMNKALSSGSKLASVGDHLKGPLAIAAMIPQANNYLDRPTWNKTKNLGSNALTGAADSISGPPGWVLSGTQALGGALGNATGNKSFNALSRIANVGDDVFHPIKNGEGILNDMKSSWRFSRRHPWQALASTNPVTGLGEVAYRHRHGLARFARHPFRSMGNGLHRLGGLVGRGWRGLKGFAGNALGGLRNTILGHGGALALTQNYLYLREINRLLPRLASKLAGMFGVNDLYGNHSSSLNQSNVTNTVPHENAESVSKNNGNTNNTDNSNHDSHDTNNYFVGYPGHSGGASGILPSSLMDFFSHTHGDATS